MDLESLTIFKIFGEPVTNLRPTFKYILVSVSVTDAPKRFKYIIRLGFHDNGFNHEKILSETKSETGEGYTVRILGGGFIQIHPGIRMIILTGKSDKLGPAPRDIVISTLLAHKEFAGFEISIE